MFGLGFWEIGLILLVALLVLGPKKLPELAKTLGKGLRELRRASDDIRSTISEPLDEVRKPLQDLRDDLVGTVHSVGREIEREARLENDPDLEVEDRVEVERRRREVEELYANAARDDQLEESTGAEEISGPTAAPEQPVAALSSEATAAATAPPPVPVAAAPVPAAEAAAPTAPIEDLPTPSSPDKP